MLSPKNYGESENLDNEFEEFESDHQKIPPKMKAQYNK